MKHVFSVFLAITLLSLLNCSAPAGFTISGTAETTIWLAPGEADYVRLAVNDLIEDVRKITGKELTMVSSLVDCAENCLMVGTVSDSEVAAILSGEEVAALKDQWEKYLLRTVRMPTRPGPSLVIAGSNPRGTMFGIYHFLEHQLGVDPLYFWTGYQPQQRSEIKIPSLNYLSTEPDFKFRGWFINDEDLLTEWKDGGGTRRIDYPYYGQVVAPEIIARVAEAAVRLRFNLMIPASFVDIRNPAEERLVSEAARRGLFLSMHHIEPVGVSAFGYQNYWEERGEDPLFSFYSEPEKLKQTWRDYAQLWAKYPDVIWQIGLRGIADRPMWLADPGVPQSDAERARLISEAMAVQRQIIVEVTGETDPLMSTTLWAEGAAFNQEGLLDIPEGVMIIFADNSPGWVWQRDFYETPRVSGRSYGVYFHHQLWGSGPHLVQGVPPAKTYQMFSEARTKGAGHYAIMNVSNIREFVLGLAASGDMLWDMENFEPENYLEAWCARRFPDAAKPAAAAYQQFFASYQLVGERQIPGLLDGQQRGRGLRILRELREQLRDTTAYRIRQEQQPGSPPASSDAFRRSLSDTNPAGGLSLPELLPLVRTQLSELSKAQAMADAVVPQLQGEPAQFFTANLVAQIEILTGIGQWLENCILAKQAADEHDQAKVEGYLQEALTACQRMQQGQQMAAQGRWEDWYRGDKKMNLQDLELQTQKTLDR